MEICGQIYTGTTAAQDHTPRALRDRHERDELPRHEKPQSADPRGHYHLDADQTSPSKRHWRLGSDRASVSTFDEDQDNDEDGSDRTSTYAPSAVSSVSTMTSLTSASRHARQADVDRPRGRYSTRGFRHADDSKTTYFVEKEGRTMYVSAPKGTTEAAAFDAIAQKGVDTGVSVLADQAYF